MLSSSEFNSAVPQFTNGNYANNPIDPSFVEEPSMSDYNRGVEPLETLPAQWWNWLCNQFTSRFNKLNLYVKNIFDELTQLFSLVNVTPDGTEGSVTTGQLKNIFKELYPTYVSDKLNLGTTYVPQTREINGHALTGNVTVTKSDVGLGNVVNTGDSATPVSGGTTKFTTGGAYTELNKKADKTQLADYQPNNFLNLSSNDANDIDTGIKCYRVPADCANTPMAKTGIINSYKYVSGQYIRIAQEYTRNDDEVNSGERYLRWGMSNNNGTTYTWSNWQQIADNATFAPDFSASTAYAVGDYVIYNGDLYRCTVAHSAGAWKSSHFTVVTVGSELETKADKTSLALPTDAVLHYSFDDVPDYPDGTADVRLLNNNTYDIQSTVYKFISDNGGTLANSNGNILITGNGAYSGARITGSNLLNKLIKISINLTEVTGDVRIGSYTTTSCILDKTGRYDIVLLYDYTGTYNNLYFLTNGTFTATIEKIYIGDGSYSTPIIDNANGQYNATNNGGIAVNGVCGKGAYFLQGKYASLGSLYKLNDNFSVSLWVNPDNTTSGLNGNLLLKWNYFILRNGDTGSASVRVYLYFSDGTNITKNIYNSLLPAKTWSHLVVTRDGTQLKGYLNGSLVMSETISNLSFSSTAQSEMTLGSNVNNRPQSIDDLLIFNRALLADEVQALYLNKANTPKLYDINNYNIDNATPVPEQNSNKLFSAGGAFDFFGGNTKANSWLGKVFYWALGRKWSEGLTNTGVGFNTVYYANGLWHGCATSSNGLWWSDNGKDWNAISVSACRDVYYANGMWVAGGAKVYWSIDGKTWTRGTGLANNSIITHVRYANGIWVAVLQAIGLVWSIDGKAWSEAEGATASAESPMDYTFGSLYYANGIWVAGGSHGLWFSGDGNAWTQGSGAPTGYTFKSICYDEFDGLWVAVSNGKGAYWSNDGIHWTAGSANQTDAQFQSVTNNADGLWVAVSQGGASYKGIWWSEDGKTWTHVTGATSNIAFWLIYYANGTWVAGGNSCGLWWSKDGKRWLKGTSESSLFDTMNFDSSCCADGIWLAGGTTLHGAYYSDYSNADIQ
jgi:hypothetical protein